MLQYKTNAEKQDAGVRVTYKVQVKTKKSENIVRLSFQTVAQAKKSKKKSLNIVDNTLTVGCFFFAAVATL